MSYVNLLQQAYNQALRQMQYDEAAHDERTKRVKQAYNLGSQAVNSYLTSARTAQMLAPLANASSELQMLPQFASTASTTVPYTTGTATSAIGPTVAAASGTGAGATAGAAGSAAAGASTGAAEGAAAGSTAAEGASSGLSSTGIGAAVGAGLAIGSSRPGQWLFPAKKFMYNTMQPLVKLDPIASWTQRSIINPIFGDPNEQEKERSRQIARLQGLKGLSKAYENSDRGTATAQLNQEQDVY